MVKTIRGAAIIVAAVCVLGSVVLGAPAGQAAPRGTSVGCPDPVLPDTLPLSEVVESHADALEAVASASSTTVADLRALAGDPTAWISECGLTQYRDVMRAPEGGPDVEALAAPEDPVAPLEDTFTLQSQPGAARTLYLNFHGRVLTRTAWNDYMRLASIDIPPYSLDADAAFSDIELLEIQRIWFQVTQYFAPFDLNVVTGDPGTAAIERADFADQAFGAIADITSGSNRILADCGCGGLAWNPAFGELRSQPAFAFTDGAGTSWSKVAGVVAHEVGHELDLDHHGQATAEYYGGDDPWAPVMGVTYYQPVGQWSKGEYRDATNSRQDDLAVINRSLPRKTDDFSDEASTASSLANGGAIGGVISTRADVDAFRFEASGKTVLSAVVPSASPLDLQLTILDGAGTTIATVDPPVVALNAVRADGLSAVWSATLPDAGGAYTALLDGVGTGDPLESGKYSDYGSLGAYVVSLDSQPTPPTDGGPTDPGTPDTPDTPDTPVDPGDQGEPGPGGANASGTELPAVIGAAASGVNALAETGGVFALSQAAAAALTVVVGGVLLLWRRRRTSRA